MQVGQPFDQIGIDVIGPLTVTEDGNRYIITAMDYLTKCLEARAVKNTNVNTIAQFIFEDIICRYGISKEILLD